MKLRFLEPALDEMMESARYYNAGSPGFGRHFLKRVAHTLQTVRIFPAAGRVIDSNLRARQVSGFPFRIVYTIQDTTIWIIAVAHNRRRPDYWKSRLQ